VARFSRENRDILVSLRVSASEDAFLEDRMEALGLKSKVDVLRIALDYWAEHAPEASQPKKPKGKG